jgi:peptide/nickel transport system permease protein
MLKFIAKRLLQAIPVLLGIITIVFFVMRVFAPDPVGLLLGQQATGERIAALREYMGFNEPLLVQYGKFMAQVFTGDLGTSLKSRQPVLREILIRLPATIELGLCGMLVSVVIGLSVGITASIRQNSLFDRLSMFLGLIGVSIPAFWMALMMIILFGVQLGWLPISGRLPMSISLQTITGFNILDSLVTGNWKALAESIRHLIMPSICIGLVSSAGTARLTRSTMLEVIRQDYIRTARAKGLRENVVILRHAFKNASIPIVTSLGMQLGGIVGGAILTETVFSWPGVGTYMVNGINNFDYAVVQAGALVLSASFVLMNLVVDVLYGYLDPRIRYS